MRLSADVSSFQFRVIKSWRSCVYCLVIKYPTYKMRTRQPYRSSFSEMYMLLIFYVESINKNKIHWIFLSWALRGAMRLAECLRYSAVEIRENLRIGCNFAYSITKPMKKSKFCQLFDGGFVKKSVLSKSFYRAKCWNFLRFLVTQKPFVFS